MGFSRSLQNQFRIPFYICIMRRFAPVFFLFAILFSQAELHQLMKLPSLLEHYAEHRSADQQLSFANFLNLHYFNQEHSANSHNHDSRLPFKAHDCHLSADAAQGVPHSFVFRFVVLHSGEIQLPEYRPQGNSSLYKTDVWQPPRLV